MDKFWVGTKNAKSWYIFYELLQKLDIFFNELLQYHRTFHRILLYALNNLHTIIYCFKQKQIASLSKIRSQNLDIDKSDLSSHTFKEVTFNLMRYTVVSKALSYYPNVSRVIVI